MKLSQMTTEQAADVLVRIAEPVANIMHDKNALSVLEKLAKEKSTNAVKFFADNIALVVSLLLKDHRTDVFEVVAALSEKTVEDVAKQNIRETINDIKNCWDGELSDFFASAS